MKIEIGQRDLVEVVERQGVGFEHLNIGLTDASFPWNKLGSIGLTTKIKDEKDINGPGYSGQIILDIGQAGGIRNQDFSKEEKDEFKRSIFPSIKKFKPDCPDHFRLILNYQNSLLLKLELEYID